MMNFKISDEFHNKFEESLDMILKTQDKTKKKRRLRKISTIAASLIMVALITVFTANATGMINLDATFKKMFGIENDERSQKLVEQFGSAPLSESTTGDVKARVLQCVNDDKTAFIMLEFEAKDNIFNPTAKPVEFNFKIGDEIIDGYAYTMLHMPDFQRQTIEQAKAMWESIDNGSYDSNDQAMEKAREQEKVFSNKHILMLTLESRQSMLGKPISLFISQLEGFKIDENGVNSNKYKVDCNIKLDWVLAKQQKSRTIQINKEYNGAAFADITLTSFGADVSFSKSIRNDQDDYGQINLNGVKYKDGSTEYIGWGGSASYGENEYQLSFGGNILDVDNVVSIYIGKNFLEIPVQ